MLCRLAFVLPLLLASAFVAGCDSDGGDERTDAERIVGTWDATTASVRGEAPSPVPGGSPVPLTIPLTLDGKGGIEMRFNADGSFTLLAQGPIGASVPLLGPTEVVPAGPPVTLPSAYVLDENAREIAFTGTQTGAVTFDVPYTFSGNDRLNFELESGDLIVALLTNAGADPALAAAVRGGSMTLTRR